MSEKIMAQNIADTLICLRQINGLTQDQLSHALVYDLRIIRDYESGKEVPSVQFMLFVARFYGVEVSKLFQIAEYAEICRNDKHMAKDVIHEGSIFQACKTALRARQVMKNILTDRNGEVKS